MGWSAKGLFCSNKFMGYLYEAAGGTLSSEECAARQRYSSDAVGKGSLPRLTDDQKAALLQTIAEVSQSGATAALKSGAHVELVTLKDAAGAVRYIKVNPPDWLKFSEVMMENGASVSGIAGGFVISFGTALLDTDVARGVQILWDSSTRKDDYMGMRWGAGRRKAMDEALHAIDNP